MIDRSRRMAPARTEIAGAILRGHPIVCRHSFAVEAGAEWRSERRLVCRMVSGGAGRISGTGPKSTVTGRLDVPTARSDRASDFAVVIPRTAFPGPPRPPEQGPGLRGNRAGLRAGSAACPRCPRCTSSCRDGVFSSRIAGADASRSGLPTRNVLSAAPGSHSLQGSTAARAYFTNGSPRRRPPLFRLHASSGSPSDPVIPLVRCEVPRVENPILPPGESHRKAYASRVQPGAPGSTDAVADRFVPTSRWTPVDRLSTRECGARLGDHGPCPGFPQYAPFRVLQESLWI